MSNVPSNIPFTDINAGHTVSEMVDIINTNFDLVNLKGGGPEGIQGIQGVFGFSGIQGIQGIQGRRGSGWVTDSNMGNAEDGDLYLAPNGDVQSYQNGLWETEYQLLSNVISPFTLTGTTIHPVDPNNKTVLGGGNSGTNATLNIVGGNTALSISNGGTIANLKIDGGGFSVESDNVSLKTSNTTLTLYGDNRILLSPLAGLTNDNTIHPLITVDNLGQLTHQPNWEWGVINSSVVPNDILTNCYVGDETHLLDGLWMDENSNINFKSDSNTSYLKINTKATNETSLKNIVKIGKNGICVGSYSNNQDLNYNIDNCGIYVAGGTSQKCGQITLVGPTTGTSYVGQDSAIPAGTDANAPTYILAVNDVQNNSIKDNSPLITLKTNSNNFSSNTLHIKGGTHINGKGYDILIDGGDGVGESNQKDKTGGDVYIAGGSNKSTASIGNELRGSLYNFGDVIIGLNPNNHPSLRSGNSTYASVRKVSGDSVSTFYDICNFTAHGNRIILDSDANNRVVNGYPDDGSCPWLNDISQTTLKFNGLTTVYKNRAIPIYYENAFMYQMLSGVYSTSVMYYMSSDTLQTKRGSNIYSLLNSSEFTGLPVGTGGNGKYRTVFSNITTNWQKIGNVVNCQTKVDFYYIYNVYNNEINIAILQPINYSTLNNAGLKPTLYAYDNIVKNGILTNIELPIYLYKQKNTNTGLLRPNYVSGNGSVYTEKINVKTSIVNATTDRYFLNNTFVAVNNNTAYTNPQKVETLTGSSNVFTTNKHDNVGILNEQLSVQANKNTSKGYLKTDNIMVGSDVTYSLLTPVAQATYIIPEYMNVVDVNVELGPDSIYVDHKRKFEPLTKAYTSLTLNYSYLLNTGFEESIHTDFIYSDGTHSWKDVDDFDEYQTFNPNQEVIIK